MPFYDDDSSTEIDYFDKDYDTSFETPILPE